MKKVARTKGPLKTEYQRKLRESFEEDFAKFQSDMISLAKAVKPEVGTAQVVGGGKVRETFKDEGQEKVEELIARLLAQWAPGEGGQGGLA